MQHYCSLTSYRQFTVGAVNTVNTGVNLFIFCLCRSSRLVLRLQNPRLIYFAHSRCSIPYTTRRMSGACTIIYRGPADRNFIEPFPEPSMLYIFYTFIPAWMPVYSAIWAQRNEGVSRNRDTNFSHFVTQRDILRNS
jgi:hypothetical protein